MAVVRFVIACTVDKMRITELAIHCNPFLALPWTTRLCLSLDISMSVFIQVSHMDKKKSVNMNLGLAEKGR